MKSIKQVSVWLSALTLAAVMGLQSCNKDQNKAIENTVPTTQEIGENSLLLTVAHSEVLPSGDLDVRFFESARIYSLPASNKNFETVKSLLNDSKVSGKALKVSVQNYDNGMDNILITNAGNASTEELKALETARKATEVQTENVVRKEVITESEMRSLFTYLKNQGCASGVGVTNPCITFQYANDGCFARAHKMRQIIENNYKYQSRKVWSYEPAVEKRLAVNTKRNSGGTCCVYWWYHVAPVVKVKMANGTTQEMVFDPSIFDRAVTINDWIAVQKSQQCQIKGTVADFYTTESRNYQPARRPNPRPGSYNTDDNNTQTNADLINFNTKGATSCSR
ncbi:MAG: protein-glutamine glutaminase family protein [Raineya sp.]|jgi:hypothetical protein|nr:protein-glutamine glutaminase family protein [Raineya sp.]